MRRLTVREMRTALPTLEDLLNAEGELVVVRRGKPIARLLPYSSQPVPPSRAALRSQTKPLTVGSEVLLRQERDER
jgi:antitoxin (DNA-binding transcriptional repressor) of toxin-antitoxin stability system